MNTATETNACNAAILALEVGTMIRIPGKKQPVRVESVEIICGRPMAFTTSGRTIGIAGGSLRADDFAAGKFWFQATPQQKPVRIDGFEVLGLAN